ncbi:glycosyltransferase family 2 protein [Trueperella pecoris]|uniref:Glycosyltransferase family 2 protein n=1 Tax=Trueperella pecoris TaxID=2733571 RepID=A0A7M1QZC4_9ACTO|nr:glycosyltransferase family 2 protein [Trueperella pecoris]QOR47243.1 glycosyltransferase family 2 protein [Trueperella pecoris]
MKILAIYRDVLSRSLAREAYRNSQGERWGWDLLEVGAGDFGMPSHLDGLGDPEEYVWVRPSGVVPACGAHEAVAVWLEHSAAAAFYGDSLAAGRYITRPRSERFSLWAMPSAGDSIIVRARILRDVLANLIEPRQWWYQLRLAAIDAGIEHIPAFLDSWDERLLPDTPGVGTTSFSWNERAEVLQKHAYVTARALSDSSGPLRMAGNIDKARVSVIIPSIGSPISTPEGNEPALLRCLRTLVGTAGDHLAQAVVVAGSRMPQSVLDEAHEIAGELLSVERVADPFNFSTSINTGALASHGTHLLLLNDDVEATAPGWLDSMLGLVTLPDVGAVGAQLLFPDGTIQHAGIIINPASLEPNHLYMHLPAADISDAAASMQSHFLAVTGACLLVSKENFWAVGGMTEELPLNYNDVDFCLKLHACGLTNMQDNTVSLIHRESTSRESVLTDKESTWLHQWAGWIGQDPFVNVWS